MRDYRSKEMRVLIAAVVCSIICLTSITFAISSIKKVLSNTSASLLGGDRVISAPEPINAALKNFVKDNSSSYSEILSFYSMIGANNTVMLTTVKAVDDSYPLYGELAISKGIDQPVIVTTDVPAPGTIWIEPRISLELNIQVGSEIEIGARKLIVAAILRDEPDRVADSWAFVPRALMNMQDVSSTQVIQPGSRINYKLLITGDVTQLRSFDGNIAHLLPPNYRLRTIDSNETSFRNLNLAEKYLNLSILVNMVIAAIAISIAVRRYSMIHTIDAALLRCFGVSPKSLTYIFGWNLTLYSLMLGLLASGLGFILEQAIAYFASRYINLPLPLPSWYPIIYGVLGSLLLILGIGLPGFIRLSKVSPLQVLRQQDIWGESNAWRLKLNLSSKFSPILRLSLNNILYNAQNNLLQVLAFALIICVALLLFNVRGDLLNTWLAQLPSQTPNYFALNIGPGQLGGLQEFLHKHDIQATEFYPMVRGTLIKINNEVVSTDEDLGSSKRTGIHRPLNLTWTMTLPVKNEILQGKWFNSDEQGKHVLSIENEIANRLGVKLGDKLTFLINTEEITATITSIRTVVWGSFTPNFYVIYPPGVLAEVPATYLMSFYLPPDKTGLMRELIHTFPAINLLSISEMIEQANTIINLLALVVAFIWFFTVAISLILMFAVILSGLNMRNYQNNLMRILGASKQQLRLILSLEYLILGAVAGLIGASITIAATKYVTKYFFSSVYSIDWRMIAVGCVAGSGIMWAWGYWGTYRALGKTPIQFRREN